MSGAPSANPHPPGAYHIPTPETKTALSDAQAHKLYHPRAYRDPHGYIKSSITLEESIAGPSYCLDEDDHDWLNKHNADAAKAVTLAVVAATPATAAPGPSSAAVPQVDEPAQDAATSNGVLSDERAELFRVRPEMRPIKADEFEMTMSVFERYVAEKQPFLHLDPDNLPELHEVLTNFDKDSPLALLTEPVLPLCAWEADGDAAQHSSQQQQQTRWAARNPYRNLEVLKPIAATVYLRWALRRRDRGGRPITPELNCDNPNDADPYVCFRRRELKVLRKTRKSDALHLERLAGLSHELGQACRLSARVAAREYTKHALARTAQDL